MRLNIIYKKKAQYKSKTNNVLDYLSSHMLLVYITAFFGYVLLASIFNWSLLLGENLMKWDIWDAEYPLQLLVTDAFANKTVMLWNPLMRYGTPHYAMVGTPVWYPITLILAKIGYNPCILSFSYIIHVSVGGFGMFLLGQQELQRQNRKFDLASLAASFIAGMIYCNSGLFMSNAQHIMIIISAAWVPYIFFFMRKYLESHDVLFAMLAGASAGMSFLGGYPELFYDTFLFLAPYTLYFQYDNRKNVARNIFNAVKKYLFVSACTVLCSAISLIPFLNIMNLLTRTGSMGQAPINCGFAAILSMLFPRVSSFACSAEISMINFYSSILVILLIPLILKQRNRNRIIYFVLGAVSFLLCFGSDSFLHGILYRFFPMYTSFRFPSVNRCILTMFILLNIVDVLWTIMSEKDIALPCKLSTGMFILIILLAVTSSIIGYMANDSFDVYFNKASILSLAKSAWVAAIIMAGYMTLFYGISARHIKGRTLKIAIFVVVFIELAAFHHSEFTSTIARYNQTEYLYNKDAMGTVQREFDRSVTRNKSVDFSNSVRGRNNLDSNTIVFNKYLDEDGYVSILLQNVNDYKATWLRNIMEQNPEAYFTNDVVTSDAADYEIWANSGGTPAEQIYVDSGTIASPDKKVSFELKELSSEELDISIDEGVIYIEGNISTGQLNTGRLRLFYDSDILDFKKLELFFYDENGNCTQFEAEYKMKTDGGRCYIDVYLPNIDTVYGGVAVISPDSAPSSASLVCVERMQRDKYVDINSFGFNDIFMTVNAPSEGYVTILQTWYKGWKAYLDGDEVPISVVDNCFMGIRVSEGEHEIKLEFRPFDFYVGAVISGLFFIALCVMIIKYSLVKRKGVLSGVKLHGEEN